MAIFPGIYWPHIRKRIMNRDSRMIGVVSGATGDTIQLMLSDIARRWSKTARLAGLIEERGSSQNHVCNAGELVNLTTGERFNIFQRLGPGSTACSIDPEGVSRAAEAARIDIVAGCDLVFLSKFGKLEAEFRSGLIPAFVAAIEAGAPILTSVAPKFSDAWKQFAAPIYVDLPAEVDAIERWWNLAR